MRRLYSFFILLITSMIFFLSCISDNTHEKFFYEGIYFEFPKCWNVEVDEIAEISYYILAREENNSFFIGLTSKNADDREMINTYFSKNRIDTTKFVFITDSIIHGRFGKYDVLTSNFVKKYPDTNRYGTVYSFNIENSHILIVKQSDTKDFIKHFKIMEESFNIEIKP